MDVYLSLFVFLYLQYCLFNCIILLKINPEMICYVIFITLLLEHTQNNKTDLCINVLGKV